MFYADSTYIIFYIYNSKLRVNTFSLQRRYNRFNVEYSFYLLIIFFPLKIPKIKTGFFFIKKMCISRLWNNWRYTSSILHILVLLRVIEKIILKTIKNKIDIFFHILFGINLSLLIYAQKLIIITSFVVDLLLSPILEDIYLTLQRK